MMTRKVFAAVAALVLLSGCTGGSSSPAASSAASASSGVKLGSAASATPQESPTLGNPAEWKLSAEGFGPAKLGEKVPAGYKYEPETECTGQVLLDSAGAKTAELWTSESGQINTVIAVGDATTTEGIKLGDATAAVKEAYPNAEAKKLSEIESYVVAEGERALVIEVVDGKVAAISAQPQSSLHSIKAFACKS